jgi:hypothetical protein
LRSQGRSRHSHDFQEILPLAGELEIVFEDALNLRSGLPQKSRRQNCEYQKKSKRMKSERQEVYVASAVRTAIGNCGGSLADLLLRIWESRL